MESIELDPRYSTSQIAGKCLVCQAEQQLGVCLRQLLMEEGDIKKLQRRYAVLLSFLKSPESKKLRDETEKYLADGKDVRVKIYYQNEGIKYEIEVG